MRYSLLLIVVLSSFSMTVVGQDVASSQTSCQGGHDACQVSSNSLLAQAGIPRQLEPQDPMRPNDPQFGTERQKDPTEEKMERDREKLQNKQRQTNLQKDTEHLLQLATELKQYVDKSNEHTLSLEVIKKADEIEKLAKSVKDKMRGSY